MLTAFNDFGPLAPSARRTGHLCDAGCVTDSGRPPIPDPIKREVRQRCGFGCVICGRPIYQYDHMVDYSIRPEHEAANLTLLCPDHHDEKTRGLLSLAKVQAANENPFNRQSGRSTPFRLRYEHENPVVLLGEELAIEVDRVEFGVDAIMIDGVPIIGFRFSDGQCLLQMNLFDENDNEVLTVVDNELTYSVEAWDFEFEGTELTVRSESRKILVKVDFRPPNTVGIARGNLYCHGVEVQVWPDATAVINTANLFTQFTARFHGFSEEKGAPVFLGIGDIPEGRWVAKRIQDVPRGGFDRNANLKYINEIRKLAKARIDTAGAEREHK